jgi:hypothetical protein
MVQNFLRHVRRTWWPHSTTTARWALPWAHAVTPASIHHALVQSGTGEDMHRSLQTTLRTIFHIRWCSIKDLTGPEQSIIRVHVYPGTPSLQSRPLGECYRSDMRTPPHPFNRFSDVALFAVAGRLSDLNLNRLIVPTFTVHLHSRALYDRFDGGILNMPPSTTSQNCGTQCPPESRPQ